VLRAALALAVAAAAPAAGAGGGEVHAEAALRLRGTALGRIPSTEVLFDPAALAFDVDGYLATEGSEAYASTSAAVRLDGRHLAGRLRWALALDAGEVRRVRRPRLVEACASGTSPTGLELAEGGACAAGAPFLLEETGLEAPAVESNGRPLGDEVASTWLVREAWLAWSAGRAGFATLRAGHARRAIADGLVHDDYGAGVDLTLDLGAIGPPFEVRASVFLPTRDLAWEADAASPVVSLRADWLPSLFEHAGLFAAAWRDRSGGVAGLFRDGYVEDAATRLRALSPGEAGYAEASQALATALTVAPSGEATLAWFGTSGSLAPWRGHRLRWTAAALRGELRRSGAAGAGGGTGSGGAGPGGPGGGPATPVDVPLEGSALHLRWEWSPARWLTLAPWFLYISGDRTPAEKERLGLPAGYSGFLGAVPFVTLTNLFFGGGLSESFSAPQATAPGVNGRGVIAPGLAVEADLPGEVAATARAAWLRAEDAGPYGGRVYGTEVDLTVGWMARPWLRVGAEADVLVPGDFFDGRSLVSKFVLAVDLVTP
jgi:hypothetical protein